MGGHHHGRADGCKAERMAAAGAAVPISRPDQFQPQIDAAEIRIILVSDAADAGFLAFNSPYGSTMLASGPTFSFYKKLSGPGTDASKRNKEPFTRIRHGSCKECVPDMEVAVTITMPTERSYALSARVTLAGQTGTWAVTRTFDQLNAKPSFSMDNELSAVRRSIGRDLDLFGGICANASFTRPVRSGLTGDMQRM